MQASSRSELLAAENQQPWRQVGSKAMKEEHAPRVVVLGGGPAGVHSARSLHRSLGKAAQVTLVDRQGLCQCLCCTVSPVS